jgi:predicted HTH transcriptional regulator
MKQQESVTYNPERVRHLKSLVAKGEGHTLEFKRKTAFPEKIIREMIAFANTSGGILLVGVGDDGSIPGLKYADDESHVISQALVKIKPILDVNETFIPLGNSRVVLQYEIAESRRKPHYVMATDQSKNTLFA